MITSFPSSLNYMEMPEQAKTIIMEKLRDLFISGDR